MASQHAHTQPHTKTAGNSNGTRGRSVTLYEIILKLLNKLGSNLPN